MRYFLYRMDSKHIPPGGGDFRAWLHFYKWGRQETVTFRTSSFRAEKGDILFFVLDGLLIGDALVEDVRNDVFIEGWGQVHEIDVAEGGIWEYVRRWGLRDWLLDAYRLSGLNDEVPVGRAVSWLRDYRGVIEGNWDLGSSRGRLAVYNPDVLPPFFGIKKK